MWVLLLLAAAAAAVSTDFDGGIIVAERERVELVIYAGGHGKEADWDREGTRLWSMPLRDAAGVPREDRNAYNNLWRGKLSLNDVKRVVHDGRVHVLVTGNGGNGVALFDFETKRCVFWSETSCASPHDAEYIPEGRGVVVVAHARGPSSYLELYDVGGANNRGRVGAVMKHKGVHSVHWDAKQKRLWAWGSSNANALKSYRVEVSDAAAPRLVEVKESYPVRVDVEGFKVGTGHGGSPMVVGGKRYLLLAGRDGLLRFDTDTHDWEVLHKDQPGLQGRFRNPKGVSFNPRTHEIITTKGRDSVYSADPDVPTRVVRDGAIYKARWWFHSTFSY